MPGAGTTTGAGLYEVLQRPHMLVYKVAGLVRGRARSIAGLHSWRIFPLDYIVNDTTEGYLMMYQEHLRAKYLKMPTVCCSFQNVLILLIQGD